VEIALNRRAGVPVKDQLRFLLELKILAGDLVPGQRLPSVRALARRLRLHPNTVSAAYQDLEATGHVDLHKGAGVFVRPGVAARAEEAESLDEIVRMALYRAFRRGFASSAIRSAVERWLAAAPPDRVVVLDPSREMAELMAREIQLSLGVPTEACSLSAAEADPGQLSGALALALPYHLEAVDRLSTAAAVEALTIEISGPDIAVFAALPEGARVLLVSYSPTVPPFAEVFMKSLRGDAIHIEARPLSASREWRRLMPAADLVVGDARSVEVLRKLHPRRLLEIRLVAQSSLARLARVLPVAAPAVV
jgi:DNA-binding transcriptional regulator YhcF (GntR family)